MKKDHESAGTSFLAPIPAMARSPLPDPGEVHRSSEVVLVLGRGEPARLAGRFAGRSAGGAEQYLYAMDARHNHPRIGRILMARGMDAADTAISLAFGEAKLVQFSVSTDEVIN